MTDRRTDDSKQQAMALLPRGFFSDPFWPEVATTAPWASPFSQLDNMMRDLYTPFSPTESESPQQQQQQLSSIGPKLWRPQWPSMSFEDTETEHQITAHVPGYAPKGDASGAEAAPGQGDAPYGTVDVHVENGVLTVVAEHKAEKKDEDGNSCASTASTYRRSVKLPDGVKDADVKASLDHGVLKIRMPKPAKASSEAGKSTRVPITSGGKM